MELLVRTMSKISPHSANLPLVSVGIPTYNRPELLARTLEHLTRQTYKNLEIIISDNASEGRETVDVVSRFSKSDDRIQFYGQPSNIGAAANFYFVMEKAVGKYFMWAADDDYFGDQNLIEALFSAIDDRQKMAFPNVNIISANESENQYRCLTNVYSRARSSDDYLIAWCKHGSGYPLYGLFNLEKVAKQELFTVFDTRLKCYWEGIFLHKLFLSGDVVYVDSVCLNYSRSATAASTPVGQLLLDFISYTRDVFQLYLDAPIDETLKKRIMDVITKIYWPYMRSLAEQTIARATPA
jgi:glycosyltransferase involved in cell wall biosynthesis